MVTEHQEGSPSGGPERRPPRTPGPRLSRFGPRAQVRRFSRLHSPIVGLLRILLPLGALALVGTVVFWPHLRETGPDPAIGPTTFSEGGIHMVSPRFASRTAKGEAYSIEAVAARQSAEVEGAVELDQPSAEITLADGTWIALLARTGEYRQQDNRLILRGEVQLHRDDGAEFVTESAQIDLSAGTASGDAPIHGQGPQGDLEAQGFRIGDGGKVVTFTGPVTLMLRGARGDEP